jgi:hypothetical protein
MKNAAYVTCTLLIVLPWVRRTVFQHVLLLPPASLHRGHGSSRTHNAAALHTCLWTTCRQSLHHTGLDAQQQLTQAGSNMQHVHGLGAAPEHRQLAAAAVFTNYPSDPTAANALSA